MWLSARKREQERETAALGTVTLGGAPAGVYADGERRNLPVFGPGGFRWKPAAGEQVLVLKTGGEGESPCVAGVRTDESDLHPGEVAVTSGAATVTLTREGAIELRGDVRVNGVPLADFCRANAGGGAMGG